jgi:replicative DNA helicase
MPEAAAVDRRLSLEAERSVLGAILIHNDAFNAAAEVRRTIFRDAHRHLRR